MDEKSVVDPEAPLPATLFRLGSKISLHAQRVSARELGLDMCEWRVIRVLGRGVASTINHIADLIAMDRGGTSRAIARLEKRGFVRREATSTDRRKSVIWLTESGHALYSAIARFADAREDRLTAKLDEKERAELVRLLKLLTVEVDQMIETQWTP